MKLKSFNSYTFLLACCTGNHAGRGFIVGSSWFVLYACKLCVEWKTEFFLVTGESYIYIYLPGLGRMGYWIAANIVILKDTVLLISVSWDANPCKESYMFWAELFPKCLGVFDVAYQGPSLVLEAKSSAPTILQTLLSPSWEGLNS